jgi:hypothetical protein
MCRVSWESLRARPETEPGLREVPRHGSIATNTMRGVSGHRLDECYVLGPVTPGGRLNWVSDRPSSRRYRRETLKIEDSIVRHQCRTV